MIVIEDLSHTMQLAVQHLTLVRYFFFVFDEDAISFHPTEIRWFHRRIHQTSKASKIMALAEILCQYFINELLPLIGSFDLLVHLYLLLVDLLGSFLLHVFDLSFG